MSSHHSERGQGSGTGRIYSEMLRLVRKLNYKGVTQFIAALGARWPAWWLEGLGESSQTTGGPADVDRETSNAPTGAELLDWQTELIRGRLSENPES